MIEIKNLTKRFQDFTALENVTCTIGSGCIYGMVGSNGAGKSTFLRTLTGVYQPDGGEIRIDGEPVWDNPAVKRRIAYVPDELYFLAGANLNRMERMYRNLYPDFDRDEFLQQCRRFNLPTDKKIKEFSTGMKAKFKVLAALSHKAELLILDEPTVGLDVIARDEVLNMLREYMEENESSSILISSHISSDLESLCDDFYMIHAGKIILHEDTDVLLSDYAVLKVSEEEYEKLDQQYLIKIRKEAYGYRCLTNQKQFYMENYPDVVIENGKIDDLVMMMEEQV